MLNKAHPISLDCCSLKRRKIIDIFPTMVVEIGKEHIPFVALLFFIFPIMEKTA